MKLTIDTKLNLNDGHSIPRLGLGVWQIRAGRSCEAAVLAALEAGYRHIDTASFYGNEESVGSAVRKSGIPREQIFVTTKLWNSDHGNPERAFDASLRRLGLDYVDLYLIHYPVRERRQSWRVLERLREKGKARSIGVSNFTARHLTELLAGSTTVPAVNQVELHPYLYQKELIDFCRERKIAVEAYSPLTHGERLNDPRLAAVAARYSSGRSGKTKSPAQVLIRWALQHDLVVIPKSAERERIFENADVFDFEISPEDMRLLDGLNENLRTCWDPTHAP
ncbi:MAG TPA: aldo/keto reductase [candidate division Zixibacteria bacterium]|nr:aldo/keto reductase [candidate division Zixibacteria bacterium]